MTPYNPSKHPEEQQEVPHNQPTDMDSLPVMEEENDDSLEGAEEIPPDTHLEATHLAVTAPEDFTEHETRSQAEGESTTGNPFEEEEAPLSSPPVPPIHRPVHATNLSQPAIKAIEANAETEKQSSGDTQAAPNQEKTQTSFRHADDVSAKTPEGNSYQFKKAKRPNRLPLVLGGSLILLIGFAICYTNSVRSTTIQQPLFGNPDNAEEESVNLAPLLAKTRAESEKARTTPVLPENAANAQQAPQTAQALPPQPDPYAEAQYQLWMQQQQKMAQDEQIRQSQIQAAMRAPTTVFSNNSDNPAASNPTETNNPENFASDPNAQARTVANMGSNGLGTAPQEPLQARVDFFNRPPDNHPYLLSTRVAAASPYELKAGTVIPSVMISGINSDLPGQLIAQVSENVYDTATGNHLLIPQGSRLVGTYDHGIALGQRRIMVAWNRIIYPDASSLDLGAMPGQDQGGYAGFHDKADHHAWPSFRNALLLSVITAGVQLSQPRAQKGDYAYSSQQMIAGSLGMQMNQLGMMNYQQGMNMAPTLKVRPGYRFNVMISKDLIIPPWQGAYRMRQASRINTASE